MDNSVPENLDETESNSCSSLEISEDCMEQSNVNNTSQSSAVNTDKSSLSTSENNTTNRITKDIYDEIKTNCFKPISNTSNSEKELPKSSQSLMNSSLFALSVYGESSSEGEEDEKHDNRNENEENNENNLNENCDAFMKSQTNYINIDDDISSVSTLSSNTSSLLSGSDFSDDDDDFDIELSVKPVKKNTVNKTLTKGELTLDDLPPIQDLFISVSQEKCVLLGTILNIIDKLVVVQGIKNLPPLDLDTVLFLEWNKPLGNVFDVFGPVIEPLYCVRFNSNDHIKEKGISPEMPVYYVPESNHTKYVFLKHLTRLKGSDASWEDNNEPPPQHLDFSDDEEERKVLKALRKGFYKTEIKTESDSPERKRLAINKHEETKRNFLKARRSQQRRNVNTKVENHVIHSPVNKHEETKRNFLKARRSQQRRNVNTKVENHVIHSPVLVPPPFNYPSSSSLNSFNETLFPKMSTSPLTTTNPGPSSSINPFNQIRYNLPHPFMMQNGSNSIFSQQQVNHSFGMHSAFPQQMITTTPISNTVPPIDNMSIPPPVLYSTHVTNPPTTNRFPSNQINPSTFPIHTPPPTRFSFGGVTQSLSFPFPPPVSNRPPMPFPAVVQSNNAVPGPLAPSSISVNGSLMQTFPNNFPPHNY